MENITSFKQFPRNKELNEKNMFKFAWDKIIDFFKRKFGKGAWWPLAKFAEQKGLLKGKVELYDFTGTEVDLPSDSELDEMELTTEGEQIDLAHPDSSVRNVDADELSALIERKWRMKQKYPNESFSTFIWGAPGIGKTDIVKQTVERLGGQLIVWHLATIEPIDFVGLPGTKEIKKEDGTTEKRTTFYLPQIFPTDNGPNGKGGIMFFDELNRANSMVLSASLQLCLDGKVGEYTIPDKWLVLAAGNRRVEVPEATEIEPALSNRFAHVNLVTTVERWQDWAMKKDYMHPDVISYMSFDKQFFHKLMDDDNPPNWPSPRSWAKASIEYSAERGEGRIRPSDYDTIRSIFSEYVGTAAAAAFVEYLKLRQHFNEQDVENVYKDWKKAKKPPSRIDLGRGAMAAIAMHKKGEKVTLEEMDNVMNYALNIDNFETCTSLLSFFKKVHPYIATDPKYVKKYREYIKKWHKEQFKSLSGDPSEEAKDILDDVEK